MLSLSRSLLAAAVALPLTQAYPTNARSLPVPPIDDPTYGPIPGESSVYSNYRGKAPPFPGNATAPILPIANGTGNPDDLLFQNLLSAEWAIYSFYQQGVERFNASFFNDAGFPERTYDRIQEIRDNEAGHLRIFQDQLSASVVKPGSCRYQYPYDATSAASYLAFGTQLELASMAFLTGLVLQAQTDASKGALVAIAETETRHEVWHLMDIWNANPFSGPADTSFPYANELLDVVNDFVVPGSCPPQNPPTPRPSQHLPQFGVAPNSSSTALLPGSSITFAFNDPPAPVPAFQEGKDYFAVFYHSVDVISVPFDVATNSTVIPSVFERNKGVYLVVIADQEGAPTLDSVVAGPLNLFEQPLLINQLAGQ